MNNDTNIQKLIKYMLGAGIVVWIIGILINVAILGCIGWVAWHFISKFW